MLLEKFQTEQRGLGLRATKFIEKGTLLMTESPFVHMIYEDMKKIYCNNCFKKSKLKCCSSCKQSFYCSTACQKKSWGFHKHECSVLKKHESSKIFSLKTLLVYRALIKLKSEIDWKKKGYLRSVTDLTACDNKKNRNLVEGVLKNLEILNEDGYNIFSTDVSNFDEVSSLIAKIGTNDQLISSKRGWGDRKELQGHGLYLNASLINHDCDPNGFAFTKHSVLYVRAVRDIQPGEEITTSYCTVLDCKQIRQSYLSENFGFKCKCNKCMNNTFENEMLHLGDGEKMTEEQVDLLELAHSSLLFMLMKNQDDNKVIEDGSKLIKKCDLPDCNVFAVKLMTLMACAAQRLERNAEAEDYFLRSIPFETKYSIDSQVAVGLTQLQVASVLDIREKFDLAIKHTKMGVEILSVCLGHDHETVTNAMSFLVVSESMQWMRIVYGCK